MRPRRTWATFTVVVMPSNPSRSHSSSPSRLRQGDSVIAAFVAERPQLLERRTRVSRFARRRFGVRRPIVFLFPSSQLRTRLHLALVGKRRLSFDRGTFRTVSRDSLRSRAFSLVDSPWMKCSRRI